MAEATSNDTLTLTPPQPVPEIDEEQATSMVKLDQETISKLDEKIAEFLHTVLAADVNDAEFRERLSGVHNMGNREIRAAATVSNRLLERPVRAMKSGVYDESSSISKSLQELRATVEQLDPSRQGDLLAPRKLLGIIPLGNKLKNYFESYQSAQTHLNAIIQALYNGQDELRKDNAALEQEKIHAWEVMQRLEQYIYVGKKLDEAIERRLPEIEAQDPEKARVVREEMLFYTRQKVQDLLTQMAVTIQGYLSMDMIRKNNLELIKGVDRATSTTISALRTAVIVAQALTDQKLVLDQISALNTTTGNLIASTSRLLKQQAARTHEQAASSAVSLDQLKQAFENIYETMDAIATYKTQALGNMKETVKLLTHEVDKAKTYLDRVRSEQQAEVIKEFELDESDEIRL
ncbi:toxic anion resistance protein [Methylocaldum sp. 14B]|uniref:toxic anion resistance protein n=1 Tax=Methylocaldum sp. 14B TaxID=1912213 RepID=UPI00098B4FDB|nr:toxic anion resistance protein [Methylocaldum sp. 14B]